MTQHVFLLRCWVLYYYCGSCDICIALHQITFCGVSSLRAGVHGRASAAIFVKAASDMEGEASSGASCFLEVLLSP